MPLLDDIKQLFGEIAGHGWQDLFARHGLNLLADNLVIEFQRDLTDSLNRAMPGFEDFAPAGRQGIQPGNPSLSLVYHAFQSGAVKWADPAQQVPITRFLTEAELDLVENLVYGLLPPSLADLADRFPAEEMAIVLFASQYRQLSDTPHRHHAELLFSRTGVSRVGNAPALFDGSQRCYEPLVADDPSRIRNLPAKYNAYLAIKITGNASFLGNRFHSRGGASPSGRNAPADNELDFWFPVHKLFNGTDCLAGMDLKLEFSGRFANEKIGRVHQFLQDAFDFDTGVDGNMMSASPFRHTDIAEIRRETDSAWVRPLDRSALVEIAQMDDQELALLHKRFPVPSNSPQGHTLELFSSSLELRSPTISINNGGHQIRRNPRSGPEYMHIRSEATEASQNLNDQTNMIDLLGANRATTIHHYVDHAGDGFVTCSVEGGLQNLKIVPSYALVTAPDFFPYVEQSEILNETADHRDIWSVSPQTLADTRFLPNVNSYPELAEATMGQDWDTGTAMIAGTLHDHAFAERSAKASFEKRVSYLTDGAAGVFAPGWDVSFDITRRNGADSIHLAAYGLGSPFPEDAKLCAALSSFWPAVAPDISRSFWPNRKTVVPFTDEEIGAHEHEASWDGEPGPKLLSSDGREFIRFKKFEYVDYTLNAAHNRFNYHLLGSVDMPEYKSRLLKMQTVYGQFPEMEGWILSSYTQQPADVEDADQPATVSDLKPLHVFVFHRRAGIRPDADFQFQLIETNASRTFMVDDELNITTG